jgi:hypothetical protein
VPVVGRPASSRRPVASSTAFGANHEQSFALRLLKSATVTCSSRHSRGTPGSNCLQFMQQCSATPQPVHTSAAPTLSGATT